MTTAEILSNAAAARKGALRLTTEIKNKALLAMADELENCSSEILEANSADIENARGKISEVMCDRLLLTEDRIKAMAQGIRDVAALPDPVGKVLSRVERPNGLDYEKPPFRSVLLQLFTKAARTSPPTRRRSRSKAETCAFCAAARKRTKAQPPSARLCARGLKMSESMKI